MSAMPNPAQNHPRLAEAGPQRRHDWMLQLAAVVSARLAAPFAWGANDCCLFAADCVHAITGQDPAADLRGTYTTELGAGRVLQAHGGITGLACDRLGPVIRADLAQPGDVGLVWMVRRPTLAVCVGQHFMAPGVCGLVVVPTNEVQRAWRCTKPVGVPHG